MSSIPTQKPPPTQSENLANISSENTEPKTELKTRRRKKRDERPKAGYIILMVFLILVRSELTLKDHRFWMSWRARTANAISQKVTRVAFMCFHPHTNCAFFA